jgi:hypothetical protein
MTLDMVASLLPIRQPGIDVLWAKPNLPSDANAPEPASFDLALYRALGDPCLDRDVATSE